LGFIYGLGQCVCTSKLEKTIRRGEAIMKKKRYSALEVLEVTDGIAGRPDCVYIIPPNKDMPLIKGSLHLLDPGAPHGLRLPIDFFFRSLAQDRQERAIGIILSGTGSDGTAGIRAIKGEGGLTLAQTPESTSFDGMPRNAIATGLVDFVADPEKMHAQLKRTVVFWAYGLRQPSWLTRRGTYMQLPPPNDWSKGRKLTRLPHLHGVSAGSCIFSFSGTG
jgi:hypothetical protein